MMFFESSLDGGRGVAKVFEAGRRVQVEGYFRAERGWKKEM